MARTHEIDGSRGEGGGQVLRSAVAIAAAEGISVRIENIRANRSSPGLRPQHRTAVEACAEICSAETEGVETGSHSLSFRPTSTPRGGSYEFDIRTAGSSVLVAQTILPPLVSATMTSDVVVRGGTYTTHAPIWEFFAHDYLPAVARLGPKFSTELRRPGFYPKGGGCIQCAVEPGFDPARPLELVERGDLEQLDVTSIVAGLPGHIARRELDTFVDVLGDPIGGCRFRRHTRSPSDSLSPGNVLYAELTFEETTTILSEMGRKGRPAEEVAQTLARRVREYLEQAAPVDPHLADQLVVPMALGAGGVFETTERTPHCETQLDLVADLLEVAVETTTTGDGSHRIEVHPT